jgi:uncharacterized membrane protein YbhN (UPF0104 family)
MTKYDDVSVVMGSRNEEKAIRKVITDIQKATNNQAEIVVVDGFTDRTPEIAKLLVASLLLSLMIWLFEGLTCYAVSIAVDAQTSVIVVIFTVSICTVEWSALATPRGISIYRGILAAVLVLFGVSFDIAIAVLDHAINLFTRAIGVPATAVIGVDISELYKGRRFI